MSKCRKIKIAKRRLCIGDLNRRIELKNRDITAPIFNTVDFIETFTPNKCVWGGVETVSGKTHFDGVATDITITHNWYISFDETVTAETWIVYACRRFDILKVENFEERNEFMKLICVDRGSVDIEASKA